MFQTIANFLKRAFVIALIVIICALIIFIGFLAIGALISISFTLLKFSFCIVGLAFVGCVLGAIVVFIRGNVK
jgi:hypothetical protein